MKLTCQETQIDAPNNISINQRVNSKDFFHSSSPAPDSIPGQEIGEILLLVFVVEVQSPSLLAILPSALSQKFYSVSLRYC